MTLRRVILESPYSADTIEGVESNVLYGRDCLRDALYRGDAPLASHLLYTQPGILDDRVLHERNHGIDAGHAWIPFAVAMVVYTDLGISHGMQQGINLAAARSLPIEFRQIRS